MRLLLSAVLLSISSLSFARLDPCPPGDVVAMDKQKQWKKASQWNICRTRCERDEDCVTLSGECDWITVNERYKKEVEDYVTYLKGHIQCAPTQHKMEPPAPVAHCVKRTCLLPKPV